MLGFSIYIYALPPEVVDSVEYAAQDAAQIGSWQAGPYGIRWLEDLVKAGQARQHRGNGYPSRYSLPAATLAALLADGLPEHAGPTVIGDDYVLPADWRGRMQVDSARLAAQPAEAWLTVDAWDES